MSQIPVRCPSCTKRFAAPINRAGQTLKCLNCQTPIRIPAAGAKPVARPSKAAPASPPPAYRPPPAAAGADNSGLVIKLAAGVGGAAVVLLVIAIVANSLGGADDASDDPVAAAPPPAATPIAANRPSVPVTEPAAEDPTRSYYERHGWVRVVDRNNRFAVWMPRKPTEEYKSDAPARLDKTYLKVNLARDEGCTIHYTHWQPSVSLPPPREIINRCEASLRELDKRQHTIVSENWGESGDVVYLEIVSTFLNGRIKSFRRVYAGSHWVADLEWLALNGREYDEQAVRQFVESFKKLP